MTTELHTLPHLTPDETNVVVAMLGTDARLIDAATFAGMTLGAFLDHLQSPNVQAHLDAAHRAARQRARIRLADAAHEAVDVLEQIARDESHDKIERRRAATTILRAVTPERRTRRVRLPDQRPARPLTTSRATSRAATTTPDHPRDAQDTLEADSPDPSSPPSPSPTPVPSPEPPRDEPRPRTPLSPAEPHGRTPANGRSPPRPPR